MQGKLAVVFGGGGARGALQVGAARALIEAGCVPDLVTGTSAGAMNAAFLAVHGWTLEGVEELAEAWECAAQMDLLPANYLWSTLRAMRRHTAPSPSLRIREFLIEHGVPPTLCFSALERPRLIVVSADLNTGRPVYHGLSHDESVLEAILLSTALPPWVMPRQHDGHFLMDGALVSGLPIDAALEAGAKRIVALDLLDAREPFGQAGGFGLLLNRVTQAIETRQVEHGLARALMAGVSVRYCGLSADNLVPIWDFTYTADLIRQGYDIVRRLMQSDGWDATTQTGTA